MRLTNFKTVAMMLSVSALVALSGCDNSSGVQVVFPPIETPPPIVTPPTITPPVTPKDMTTAQAKDAMALNAIVYPLTVGIGSFSSCLSNATNIIEAAKCLLPSSTVETPSKPTGALSQATVAPTVAIDVPTDINSSGTYNCSVTDSAHGQYTITATETSYKVEFGTGASGKCFDYSNNQYLHEQLVIAGCVLKSTDEFVYNTVTEGTYKVEYSGSVECSKMKYAANNYIYEVTGNNDTQAKSKWIYDGSLEQIGTTGLNIAVDGSIQGIINWMIEGNLTETSNETWSFYQFNLAYAGSELENTIAYKGKFGYNGTLTNFEELFMNFSDYTYIMNHSGFDVDVTVTGGLNASCHPAVVTYATTTAPLEDIDIIRDANGTRMPSDGSMSVAIPGYKAVPAVFGPTAAEVTITSSEGDVTYGSWKEITTGSSCQALQDMLDGGL